MAGMIIQENLLSVYAISGTVIKLERKECSVTEENLEVCENEAV